MEMFGIADRSVNGRIEGQKVQNSRLVHPDKVPMSPGFGQQPRFIVTIQPTGSTFNPPAPIVIPNVDGLAPNSITEMYSFDHDIGSFTAT